MQSQPEVQECQTPIVIQPRLPNPLLSSKYPEIPRLQLPQNCQYLAPTTDSNDRVISSASSNHRNGNNHIGTTRLALFHETDRHSSIQVQEADGIASLIEPISKSNRHVLGENQLNQQQMINGEDSSKNFSHRQLLDIQKSILKH